MIDFYDEGIAPCLAKYQALLQSFPTWLYWVYFGLLAAAIVYSLFFSRIFNRVFWLIFSLTVPFFAFPLQMATHFEEAEFWMRNFNEDSSGVRRRSFPVRRRFFIVPAVGALSLWLFNRYVVPAIPYPVRQQMNESEMPWALIGAITFLTILFLFTYFAERKNTLYLSISQSGFSEDTTAYNEMYGHKVYNRVDDTIPESHIMTIANHYMLGRFLPNSEKDHAMYSVEGIYYNISVFSQDYYNKLIDVETVVSLKSLFSFNVDKITYIQWSLGKNNELTDDTVGGRYVLWRVSHRLMPLMMEFITSFALIWFLLTPDALNLHINVLSAVLGWFT